MPRRHLQRQRAWARATLQKSLTSTHRGKVQFNGRERRRGRARWATALLASALALTGCIGIDQNLLEEAVEGCISACGVACFCALSAPVIVAGTAGCVLGGCTRCAEGDSAMVDDDEVVRSEPPPPTRLAEEQRDRAEMDY